MMDRFDRLDWTQGFLEGKAAGFKEATDLFTKRSLADPVTETFALNPPITEREAASVSL